MSGIDNHDRNEYITTAEALALFRKLQLEEQNQRDEGLHGAELPLEISEYLDGTPAYELKEEFKRFKRQIAKYKNDNWNRPEQINKELIPELKKWKIDTFQVVSSIYKYSDNTRAQARASTEIYTQLQYLQQKVHFDNDEDREIFEGAIDQAAKLATFGFGQAKFQDNDAKELATKALRVPASLKHLEKTQDEDRVSNAFDQEFIAKLHQERFQQRLLSSNYQQQQAQSRPFGRGGYRGNQRGYTRPFTRPFGGNFHQRGKGRGNHFASSSNTNNPTDTNQQA
ncbi:hypothetical protein G6F37_013526 [Rhizopus arrhizus]|nr:hypothetical protein G6F37_013526 [Rhizopus arrhizus]